MHVSVGLAALCAWWYFLQDVPSLERKLLTVLLFPVSAPHFSAYSARSIDMHACVSKCALSLSSHTCSCAVLL